MKSTLSYQIGFLGLARFRNMLASLPKARMIESRYYSRLFTIVALSLLSIPLRLLETIIWSTKISQVEIDKSPIFILGHWRSGTTHLHNLLVTNTSFGYVSTFQSIAPECSLVGGYWLDQLLRKIFPMKRPMDNMVWPLDSPQEEEIGLSKMLPWGFYTSLLFPKAYRETFYQATHFDQGSVNQKDTFIKTYRKLLAIATIRSDGNRLVLKSPVNTARIEILLELFPSAKFIHIARNPYQVFDSTLDFVHKLTSIISLQALSSSDVIEMTIDNYRMLMSRYFRDRTLIPEGQLVELKYENLVLDPINELKRIYQELSLGGFEAATPKIIAYLEKQSTYQRNQHKLTKASCHIVNDRWGFAFAELGYQMITDDP
jgi:hypothetical protein